MRRIAFLVGCMALFAWARARAEDTIELFGAGGKPQTGSLAGYVDGHVLFQGADKATVKVPPNRVLKLTIDPTWSKKASSP